MDGSISSQDKQQRAITIKSCLFGLMGICFMSGLAGYVELRMPSAPPMIGTHLPAGAFLFIMLIALLWNSVFSRTMPALVLNPKELIVVLGMTLVACFPPTAGFFRYFQRQLILPWYYFNAGGLSDWKKFGILDHIPSKLFPQPVPAVKDGVLQLDSTVYWGFVQGLAKGNETVGLFDLPWHGWIGPLLYWGPLVLLMSICVMSLSLLVHQQWANHEQLNYPLAQVASSFMSRKEGKGIPDLFRSKLFWWGFAPVFCLYVLEYLSLWFPTHVPGIRTILPNLKHWSLPLTGTMPFLKHSDAMWYVENQSMFFSVIGLAYFVASEISLTMGLSQGLLALFGLGIFATTGTPLVVEDMRNCRAGAYIGYALILVYTGRTYYRAVFRKALGFGKPTEHERASVMAARLTIFSFVGFYGMLVLMGLDWLIALFFSLLLMLVFLVFTRIICETGVPFMQTHWWPGYLLTGVLGPAAVGPGPLVLIVYLGTILCQDPRECLMPYMATSLKMADNAKIRLTRVFWILMAAVLIALVVGFLSTTWTLYNFGGITTQLFASKAVPVSYLDEAARKISELNETRGLEGCQGLHGLAKLTLFSPDPTAMVFVVTGMAAVFVFSMLRFRFARFPLHPVLFLVWGIYATASVWASFLVGWAVKTLVVRFGGGKVYQNLKPLFVGLIAGELIMVGVSILIELLYYWITGNLSGIKFSILVG